MKTLSSPRITEFSYPDFPFITGTHKFVNYIIKEARLVFL